MKDKNIFNWIISVLAIRRFCLFWLYAKRTK